MRHIGLIEVRRKYSHKMLTPQNSIRSETNYNNNRRVVNPATLVNYHENRIVINASGHLYETYKKTLEKYPSTLLGDSEQRLNLIDKKSGELFINRNRSCFEAVLFFYQSNGNLLRPPSVLMSFFVEECRWYKLPEDAIKRMKQREAFLYKKEKPLPQSHLRNSLIYNCWTFLERPREFSQPWLSQSYFCFIYFTIIYSVALFCMDTEIPLHGEEIQEKFELHKLLVYSEFVVNIIFIVELSFRFLVSPHQRIFFKKPTNVFDLLSILIFVAFYGLGNSGPRRNILYISRMLYIFRLSRLGRVSKAIKTSFSVFLEAFDDVLAVLFTLLIIIIFGGTIMYYFESGVVETKFKSIPDSMWWAMQTSLCLGYGDIIPETFLGRYMGLLVLYGGVVVVMILILSLGGRVFDMYIREFDENCGGFLPDCC